MGQIARFYTTQTVNVLESIARRTSTTPTRHGPNQVLLFAAQSLTASHSCSIGTGFATFDLPPPLPRVSVGICMDLNTLPENTWTSLEDGPYELASHALEHESKVLILLNNWLLSSEPPAEDDDGKHDWNTLQYWATRLRPLWSNDTSKKPPSVAANDGKEEGEGEETIVVVCNRSGTENGKR